MFYAKASLNAYAKSGCSIYTGKAGSEKNALRLAHIASTRTSENSELCKWLGFGVSMFAGSVESAASHLDKYKKDHFQQLGLEKLQQTLETQKGKDMLAACTALNSENEQAVDAKEIKAHVKNMLNFFTDDEDDKLFQQPPHSGDDIVAPPLGQHGGCSSS